MPYSHVGRAIAHFAPQFTTGRVLKHRSYNDALNHQPRLCVNNNRWFVTLIAVMVCFAVSQTVFATSASETSNSAVSTCPQIVPSLKTFQELETIEKSHQYLEVLEGKTIRSIQFLRINVFDDTSSETLSSLKVLVNDIHSLTKEETLKDHLLFKTGQVLEPAKVIESERVLRSLGYLTKAFIVPAHTCDDVVDLWVMTQDAWTTNPKVSFGRDGGDSHHGFGLEESNFLGTGNRFFIGYEKEQERSGVSFGHSTKRFLGHRLSLDVDYGKNTDGENIQFNVFRPFYSLASPFSFGTKNSIDHYREIIRYRSDIVNEYAVEESVHEAFVAAAVHVSEHSTHRLSIGATVEDDGFEVIDEPISLPPEDRQARYVWAGVEWIQNKYSVYRNVNQIQRVEDVAMGAELSLRFGYGFKRKRRSQDMRVFKLDYSNAVGWKEKHFMQFNVHYDGYFYHSDTAYNHSLLTGEFRYHYLIDDNHRWFLHGRYDKGKNMLPHEQLKIGGDEALRGYSHDYLRGEERVFLSLERRFFSDVHIFDFMRLGAAASVEVGKLLDSLDQQNSPVLSSVSIGLRLSSSKTHLGRVVFLDLATPLKREESVDSYQLLLGARHVF